MIVTSDDTGKPITPIEALKWHEQEIKSINKLLKDKNISKEVKKEFRLYKKKLTISQGCVIIAINKGLGK